jgi:hypothetical protein
MPVSADSEQEIPGQSLAVWAEVLYLSNLLIAPGLAFLVLLWRISSAAPARRRSPYATCARPSAPAFGPASCW